MLGSGRIVAQLVERQIPVRALVRNREKAAEILPAGVEIVVGDVQQADKLEALIADCSVLLCATGARPSFNPTEPLLVDYLGTKNLPPAPSLTLSLFRKEGGASLRAR